MNTRQKLGNLGKKLKPNTISFAFKSISLTRIGYNVADAQVSAVCIVQSLHMRCGYFGISATHCGELFSRPTQFSLYFYCAIFIAQFITRTQISHRDRNVSC